MDKARLGGLRRIQLHGNPGTPEGRAKGGRRAVAFFHSNPDRARELGFILRKEIKYPRRSKEPAELIGIILGDGGLPGNHQLTIAFNSRTDNEHARFMQELLHRLFKVSYHIHYRKGSNGADIVVSSSNLVNCLVGQELKTGNKVKNQVDIPEWINRNTEYQKACLRGLIDTDGSFYSHKYNSGGKSYRYLKLCFTNRSKPLLNSVLQRFRQLNLKSYLHGNQVFINSGSGIKKYFEEIGTHNPKHLNKIRKFLTN